MRGRHRGGGAFAPVLLSPTTPDQMALVNRLGATLAASFGGGASKLKPADLDAQNNPLRPLALSEMVGQQRLRPLLRRLIDRAISTGRPLDHLLLVGASGTGKSTIALVVARELGRRVFLLKAPLDMGTLNDLQKSCIDGDVVFVDETHMQVHGDRRGITQACDPENFYMLLEDGVLSTSSGPKLFPKITWIGATTDVGLLPEPLINRFPIQPRLEPYTVQDMVELALRNMRSLGLGSQAGVAEIFAGASRANPRQLNSYVKSAMALGAESIVTINDAREVVLDLAGMTLDGLTPSMQLGLRFLYGSCRREAKDGTVTYSASANALATACGHGRDTKAWNLLSEPYLIQRGLLTVQPRGRVLTDMGVGRARGLS